MTDEKLDQARAAEAERLAKEQATRLRLPHENILVSWVALLAARLAREGWTPPAPVDPLVPEARQIIADVCEEFGWHEAAKNAVTGHDDGLWTAKMALAALKRGIEIGKAEARPMFDADGDELCWHKFPGMKLAELMSTIADAKRWNTALPTAGVTEHNVGDIISVMGWKFVIEELSVAHDRLSLSTAPPHALKMKPVMEVTPAAVQPWKARDEVLVKGRVTLIDDRTGDGRSVGIALESGQGVWAKPEWLVRP